MGLARGWREGNVVAGTRGKGNGTDPSTLLRMTEF
jgi:hypothetical protein